MRGMHHADRPMGRRIMRRGGELAQLSEVYISGDDSLISDLR